MNYEFLLEVLKKKERVTVTVGWIGEDIVSLIGVEKFVGREGDGNNILLIWTQLEARRNGYATELMKSVVECMKGKGGEARETYINSGTAPTKASQMLYKSLRFSKLQGCPTQYTTTLLKLSEEFARRETEEGEKEEKKEKKEKKRKGEKESEKGGERKKTTLITDGTEVDGEAEAEQVKSNDGPGSDDADNKMRKKKKKKMKKKITPAVNSSDQPPLSNTSTADSSAPPAPPKEQPPSSDTPWGDADMDAEAKPTTNLPSSGNTLQHSIGVLKQMYKDTFGHNPRGSKASDREWLTNE
ncbi:hypothetical protein TrRE_jg3480, partial [Triparma retinervis]